jgi:lysophospholipase L1-like esterase
MIRLNKPAPQLLFGHKKKALSLLIFLAVLSLLLIVDRILAINNPLHLSLMQRYILLKEYEPLYSVSFVPPPEALRDSDSLVNKTYYLRVDADGFIMPAKIHPQPEVTLAFLGGSTTECLYMEESHRFPYVVGRLLEQATGKQINSYNAGISGINTQHCLNLLLNKVLPLNPQVAILMENINDLSTLLYEKTYWGENSPRGTTISQKSSALKEIEKTLHLIRDRLMPNLSREIKDFFQIYTPVDEFSHLRGKKISIDKPYLRSEFSMNLEAFINICRANLVVPVLMTQENRLKNTPDPIIAAYLKRIELNHGITYTEFKDLFDSFNQTIMEVGKANAVPVIDLAQQVPPEKAYLYDVVHLTDKGSKLAAQTIHQELIKLIK